LPYPIDPSHTPFFTFLVLYITAGLFFLLAVYLVVRNRANAVRPFAILIVGAAMRLFVLPSTPILEDDFYRYLWDGAVTATAINPYRFAPRNVILGKGDYPKELDTLARQSNGIINKFNYPEIRTIYPPVAQGVFALSYMIKPWSIPVFRAVVLSFDCVTAGLLLLILARLKLPIVWIIIYWWNPLVVKELVNACHMDVVALAPIAAALYSLIRKKPLIATGCIVVAGAVKLWPIVFLLLLWRSLISGPLKDHKALSFAVVLTAVMTLPMVSWVLAGQIGADSGFITYSRTWQNNDANFRLLHLALSELTYLVGGNIYQTNFYTRELVVLIYLVILALLCYRPSKDARELIRKFGLATTTLFLLSPTQFPWYYLWIVPFLTIAPFWPLLLYCLLLPIYYLQYYLPMVGYRDLFYNSIVWFEHLPFWIAIGFEIYRRVSKGGWRRMLRIRTGLFSRIVLP